MIQLETIFNILWKGFIIGVIVSAPLGPVGVLCIQRTLNKGRWYGFVTGIGAAMSDIFYALLTGYGMSFVFDYVNKNIFYLQLFGSVLLLAFGIYTFRSNPVHSLRPVSTSKGTYLHNFITAFLLRFPTRLSFCFLSDFSPALRSLVRAYSCSRPSRAIWPLLWEPFRGGLASLILSTKCALASTCAAFGY